MFLAATCIGVDQHAAGGGGAAAADNNNSEDSAVADGQNDDYRARVPQCLPHAATSRGNSQGGKGWVHTIAVLLENG